MTGLWLAGSAGRAAWERSGGQTHHAGVGEGIPGRQDVEPAVGLERINFRGQVMRLRAGAQLRQSVRVDPGPCHVDFQGQALDQVVELG